MARVIGALCIVLLAGASCGRKQTDIEQLRAAVRKTLTTRSFRVVAKSQSLGADVSATTLEHIGSDARVLTGTTVRGVFIGNTIYAADNVDPSTFMRCPRRGPDGKVRRFDTYSGPLRAAARAKRVRRRGGVLVIDPLLSDQTTRTTGELTLAGGRVTRMKLIQHQAGAGNISPPLTIDFRFDYGPVPAITAPPSDTLEAAQGC